VLAADREAARRHVAAYFELPSYVANFRRLGYGDADFADGGSDALVDALVAWGDEEAIAERVREHVAAGADHVCIQVIDAVDDLPPREAWRRLAPALIV
jgi:probable F420-dependent oxidoreductase